MKSERTIREIMTTDLVTVKPDAVAKDIYDLFKKYNFHHLPVVENGEILVGIISKEDFFRVSYLLSNQTTGKTWSEKHYQTLAAKDFMTTYPMTLDPDDTVGLAADIFLSNKFHALPVVEDQQLIGIVTTHDLLQFSFNSPYADTDNVKGEEEMDEEGFIAGDELRDDDDNYLF
ncbi:MAG: CBS domain-containing protein [Saprospiraceae bacterium]